MNEERLKQLARNFAELTPAQRKLFLQRLAAHDIDFSLIPIVPCGANKDHLFPASYAQARLWHLWNLNPESPAYTMRGRLTLSGTLNETALVTSINSMVARHEMLRTTFVTNTAGEVLQHIHPFESVTIRRLDLEGATEHDVLDAAEREELQPFNLSTGPLLRVVLICQSTQHYLLLLTAHHIVSDGWSATVMLDELAQAYYAACTGTESTLSPLPIQYSDFSQWQRHWLEAGEGERQLTWWREFLGTNHPQVKLPVKYTIPPEIPHRAARYEFTISPELQGRARCVAQQYHVTLFMVLLAGFNVLLYRYSGQTDIRLGIPAAGRQREESSRLIGLFVNTLVLRTCFTGETRFTELLAQVKNALLGVEAHQDLPFQHLVEVLDITRQEKQHPLFQIMVNHQVTHTPPTWPGLVVNEVSVGSSLAKFDLTLTTEERADGSLCGVWVYSSALFTQETIAQLNTHFFVILKQCLDAPNTLLAQLSLLTYDEHRDIARWNKGALATPPLFTPIHQTITEQVLLQGTEQALLHSAGTLSWYDLEAQANQLAHQLLACGVGAEVCVGVHVTRSSQMIIAMFSVLKAGGTFVPLDPDYPSERIAYMLKDSGVLYIVTEHVLANRLPGIDSLNVLYLEDARTAYPTTDPGITIHPEQSAYMIYTSGSTGQPKGVTVAHHTLAQHCKDIGARYDLSAKDRVLHFASINFDLAHEYWLMPLSYGASLLITDSTLWGAKEMCEQLIRHEVTVAAFPPSYLLQLTQVVLSQGIKLPLRVLAFGGEALSCTNFDQVRTAFNSATLINGYGPTEAVISPMLWISTPKSDPISWEGGAYLPIGTSVGARSSYVLDASLNPLPVGVAGELYLGGTLLARGYHQRAHLTAERFIPDPWAAGGRLYRTGDRACWRDDGSVAYLGRIDNQVKLRGQRIELGEIEAQILACSEVRETVVMLQGEEMQARLVAYVVPHDAPLYLPRLKQQLMQRLPTAMIPTQWVELNTLPVNGSGKLDRHALPLPDAQSEVQPYRAPQSVTEIRLAAIWAEVLPVERVGVDDHFFMLGGHSLLAMQICVRIQNQMGLVVPLRMLFDTPLFEAFAQRVESECSKHRTEVPTLIPPHDPEHIIPLSFAQQSMWFLWQLMPHECNYNIFIALRCRGKLDHTALQCTLDELIIRHVSLRTTFNMNAQGVLQQKIHAPTPLLIRHDDLSHYSPTTRLEVAQRIATEEEQQPFDLSRGPLIRLRVLHLAPADHIVLFTIHHIVADGWSMGVFFKEFMVLYRAELMGDTTKDTRLLPTSSLMYADYASWQQRSERERASSLAYWRTQLTDLPQLRLPSSSTSFGRPLSLRCEELLLHFDAMVLQEARVFAQKQGATLSMLLQTVFHVTLYRHTGQVDQCIGTLLSNRDQLSTENLVGLFLNTLPLVVRIDPTQSLAVLLSTVKESVLGAQAHAIPFIQLVKAIRPPRSTGCNPLFQVLYHFMAPNNEVLELTLPNLQIEDFPVPRSSLMFDFELNLAEDHYGQVRGALSYAIERVDAEFARALWADYSHLLMVLLNAPSVPLAALIAPIAQPEARKKKSPKVVSHHDVVLEAQLATMFMDVLNLSTPLMRDDNFFNLGISSLDCVVVVERARQQGFTLCVNDLFVHQTLAELASALAVSSMVLP